MHSAAALIILSAFFHAGWNALLHRRGAKAREATLMVLLLCLVLSALVAGVASPRGLTRAFSSPWAWASGVSEGVYFLTLGVVMERLPLGLGYLVMRGISMLMVTTVSLLFLGEQLTPIKALGMVAIAAGVALRGLGDVWWAGGGRAPKQPQARYIDGRGMAAAGACAVGISGYHLAYGRALAQGIEALPLFAASLTVAVASSLLFSGPRTFARAITACRHEMASLSVAALACMGSFWLFLSCLGVLHAGVAICLRNLSVVFAQAMAWASGEPITTRGSLAVLFFMVGGALLVLAP